MLEAILESYIAMEYEINDIAYEEDTATNAGSDGTGFKTNPNETTTNDANQSSEKTNKISTLGNSIHTRIADALEKFQEWIMRTIKRLKNLFQRMQMTDRGFEKTLASRQQKTKPLESLRITTYMYKEGWLNAIVSNMEKRVIQCLNQLLRAADPRTPEPPTDSVLQGSTNEIIPALIQEILKGTPNSGNVKDAQSFLKFLETTYRGPKRDILYRSSDLNNLIEQSKSHRAVNLNYQKKLQRINEFAQRMKSRQTMLKGQSIADDMKKKFLICINKAMKIYNLYDATLRYAYELELERCLSARLVVQKFYQF